MIWFLIGLFPFFLIFCFFILITGLRVIQQYERGVHFRLGKVVNQLDPGLRWIVPFIDRVQKVNMRTVTMPIPAQKIITKDNVSIDVAAVAYYRIVDAVKAVVIISNVISAVDQIAQTTVRNIAGQFTLDEVLSKTDSLNEKIKVVIDTQTEAWGVVVSIVEIKDIQLPESMQRAMAKEAEAEREKRAKVIAAEGEFLSVDKLGQAADVIMKHPIALQLRTLQVLTEIAVEKNSTIVFPTQFFSTLNDVNKFLQVETKPG